MNARTSGESVLTERRDAAFPAAPSSCHFTGDFNEVILTPEFGFRVNGRVGTIEMHSGGIVRTYFVNWGTKKVGFSIKRHLENK